MTSRRVDISQLTTLSRKLMTAKILEKRDKIAIKAKGEANSSLGDWRSTAPVKTGQLRNSFKLTSNKSGAQLTPINERLRLVNILNNRGKTKGFYSTFVRKHGQAFFKMVGK